jgi:hypothetical protein
MSSLLTRLIWEAERDNAWEFIQALRHDEGLQEILREKGLRAAMQVATSRPAMSRPAMSRPVDMRGGRVNRPAGPGEAGPVRVGPARAGSSTQFPHGAGTPVSHNSTPGRPDVTVVGRARPSTMAHPIRSAKSKIVPEPDQIQSAPPVRPTLPHQT